MFTSHTVVLSVLSFNFPGMVNGLKISFSMVYHVRSKGNLFIPPPNTKSDSREHILLSSRELETFNYPPYSSYLQCFNLFAQGMDQLQEDYRMLDGYNKKTERRR